MGFLIRSAFWLSLVLLIIPFDGGSAAPEAESVGAFEAMNAAREAIGDVSGICERKPEVCETAGAALHTIGVRAREGARIAYEALDERFGEADQMIQTGSVVLPVTPMEDIAQN